MRSTLVVAGLAACLLPLPACIGIDVDEHSTHIHDRHEGAPTATAVIESRSGSSLTGHATFLQVDGGVLVEVTVEDAPPGWHAVHVHEKGDCSADDGSSAGGHFNPSGVKHGAPHAMERHAGDLGNMWVDDAGRGHHVLLMPDLTVTQGPRSVVGRSIVVHADADDLVSQPTGAAGGRIGCGEIGK